MLWILLNTAKYLCTKNIFYIAQASSPQTWGRVEKSIVNLLGKIQKPNLFDMRFVYLVKYTPCTVKSQNKMLWIIEKKPAKSVYQKYIL